MKTSNKGKRVRIKDVAEMAGVSPATASLILNKRPGFSFSEETIERVETAAKELGYKTSLFAVNHPRGSTKLIGMYLGELFTMRDGSTVQFTPKVFDMFSEVTTSCFEYRLFPIALSHSARAPQSDGVGDRLGLLVQSGVGGILALGPSSEIGPYLREFAEGGTPVVQVFGEPASIPHMLGIDVDNRAMGLIAGRELLRAGYRRIVGVHSHYPSNAVLDRIVGYRTAMQEAGRKCEVIEVTTLANVADRSDTPFEMALARQRIIAEAGRFVSQSGADAFFTTCAGSSALILQALTELGRRVPQECGVVGVDQERDYSGRAISHLSCPWDLFGRRAVSCLVDMIAGRIPAGSGTILFEPTYTRGETCRPPQS